MMVIGRDQVAFLCALTLIAAGRPRASGPRRSPLAYLRSRGRAFSCIDGGSSAPRFWRCRSC